MVITMTLIDINERLTMHSGIRLVAIGNGTPEMAKEFWKSTRSRPDIRGLRQDQRRDALQARRQVRAERGRAAVHARGLREEHASAERHSRRSTGTLNLHWHVSNCQITPILTRQLRGVFVISPGKGMIYRRLENYIGSTTDMPKYVNDSHLITRTEIITFWIQSASFRSSWNTRTITPRARGCHAVPKRLMRPRTLAAFSCCITRTISLINVRYSE